MSGLHEGTNYTSMNGQLDSSSMYGVDKDSNHTPAATRPYSEKNGAVDEEVADKSHYLSNEIEDVMWEPPEQEDPEDDVQGSLTYNDDDDDEGCKEGLNWGNPNYLSTSTGDGSGSYRLKEEKQRALEDVVNGKFRSLVAQLLRSIGIISSGEDEENWVDIITLLSWEAASFLRPDVVDGKGMVLDEHIKVKCIACGTRSQR